MRTPKRLSLTILIAVCLLPVLALAAANPIVMVRNGSIRGLPPGTMNTAAYMTLVNESDEALELTGASTPVANSAMLHKTVRHVGGVMAMEHVMSATLPARGQLKLESGGLHLMLMGLKRPLKDGTIVKVTLQFEGGFSMTVDLPVVSVLNE
jgi:copper(I)-binding protein